jgi:hypothetical protein
MVKRPLAALPNCKAPPYPRERRPGRVAHRRSGSRRARHARGQRDAGVPHAGGKPWAGPSGIRLAIPIGVPRGGGWLLNDRQDRPLVTDLDETSLIQLGTCHMMLLFHANYYADGGAVQMIGDGQDIIVSETGFERTEGLYAWGRSSSRGFGPTCRVQFLGNTIIEGNHLWNYNGSYPYHLHAILMATEILD